ncbi:MAG: tRNA 2-thiouridine(34) synthase MnmA [Spirochaetes bacterium]|nr:tRNA 2-thiouridine(34) synthase MnmA [Spirochaetota bacterium]
MNDTPVYAVGLSGGVDSSVVAALLASRGQRVIGLTMKIWNGAIRVQEDLKHACYGPGEEEDIAACERLCSSLGIPYHVLDLADDYQEAVLNYFRDEYLRGRTPNPCVACNHTMKFGFLLSRAREAGIGFDRFATGHYARIDLSSGRPRLRMALDAAKDQSYFLYRLAPATLSMTEFPLGELTKAETRDLARSFGLEVSEKPESQDFIAGGDYGPVFEGSGVEPGDIVDDEGQVLGQHRGIVHYTIGQRRGIGVSAGPEALYVTAIDAGRNRIVVSKNASLFADGFEAGDAVLADLSRDSSFAAFVRIRQNHKPVPSTVTVIDGAARVEFDIPQRAVAPGQSAVFYDADGFVLGGGIIDRAIHS